MEEIERKFLVAGTPPEGGETAVIEQAYLAREGGVEVRIRRSDDRRLLTVKAGKGLSRQEVELDLEPAIYDDLWSIATNRRVAKTRRRIPLEHDLVAELDVFSGALEGLRLVEVEFPDRVAAENFSPPDWFGDEVTGVSGWSNADLAQHGPPQR